MKTDNPITPCKAYHQDSRVRPRLETYVSSLARRIVEQAKRSGLLYFRFKPLAEGSFLELEFINLQYALEELESELDAEEFRRLSGKSRNQQQAHYFLSRLVTICQQCSRSDQDSITIHQCIISELSKIEK